MKTLIIILFHVMFGVYLSAQPVQQWVSRYNGTGNSNDRAWSMAEDNAGNIYVCGFSTGAGGKFDMAIIKYSSEGSELWVKRYSSAFTGDDVASKVIVDNTSSSVYVTGISEIQGGFENVLIKYDFAGVQQWIKTYPGPILMSAANNSLALDAEGNIYMSGGTATSTGNDMLVVKYKYSGDELWARAYDGPGFQLDDFDVAQSLAVDSRGNVCISGISDASGTFDDYATLKYSSSGSLIWENRYNGSASSFDDIYAMVMDNNDNIYVTGSSANTGTDNDCVTIKYDSAGAQQWVASYNGAGSGADGGYSVAVDGSGGIYVTGICIGAASSGDYITIKYNSAGVQQWAQVYNGPGNSWDNTVCVKVNPAGDIFVTGVSWGGSSKHDYATVKYNSSGVQQWVQRYGGTANQNDYANAMLIGANSILVTGWSINSGVNEDYTTIKYSTLTGIGQVFGEIPENFKLRQNYPNPFNPETNISFDLPASSNAKLTVYDMLGRKVQTLVNETLNAGSYNINWNASGVTSGVYIYKLEAGNYTDTKKMILVK